MVSLRFHLFLLLFIFVLGYLRQLRACEVLARGCVACLPSCACGGLEDVACCNLYDWRKFRRDSTLLRIQVSTDFRQRK